MLAITLYENEDFPIVFLVDHKICGWKLIFALKSFFFSFGGENKSSMANGLCEDDVAAWETDNNDKENDVIYLQ